MHSAGGQRKRAVVIGGSIGGLFAGLFLRKVGWDVSIHERAGEELGSRGAGIATHDELHEALALATGQGGEIGVAVGGRIVLARSGDVVCEVARPQVLASWDRIWQRLRLGAGDVYRHGSALVSVEQDKQRALARFDDGSEVAADLLVAADGIQSTVRRQVMPAVGPRYAGYVAWRGLVDMVELSAEARDLLRNRFAFCLPDREQALGYPVDGGLGSAGRYNCVWYRPADPAQDLSRLLTGAAGRQYSGAVPTGPVASRCARADAGRRRRAAGAAYRRGDDKGAPAAVAGDRRPGDPGDDCRPRRATRGCALRGATACRHGHDQSGGRCAGAGDHLARQDDRCRIGALRSRDGWPMISVSFAAADILEPTCRRKPPPTRSSGKPDISVSPRW